MTNNLEDRLRQAFAHRAEQTVVGTDGEGIDRHHQVPSHLPRSIVAVAAAGVLLIGGLVALGAARSEPAAPANQPSSLPKPDATTVPSPVVAGVPITGDFGGLSLDGWIVPPAVGASEPSWTVLDTSDLGEGVELTDQSGMVLLGFPIDANDSETGVGSSGMAPTYRYSAGLRYDTTVFSVVVTSMKSVVAPSMQFGSCAEPAEQPGTTPAQTQAGADNGLATTESVVDINGTQANVFGSLICWTPAPGVDASVEVVGSSSPGDAAAAIDLARQIKFTDVERLPQSATPQTTFPAPDHGDFSGTLNGIPWLAVVDPSSLRTMNTYADGRASGAFQNDRLSQPTDTPATTGELSLDGIPGAGAIVYGYVAPEVVEVRATNNTGDTIMLPVLQRELESFFAVPIPEGATVNTLEFLRADGTDYASADIGPLPKNLEGGYGGLVTIKRSPSTAD